MSNVTGSAVMAKASLLAPSPTPKRLLFLPLEVPPTMWSIFRTVVHLHFFDRCVYHNP
jgi:hypothetical protein